MKYRVVSTIAPACDVTRGVYSNFDDAHKEYLWNQRDYGFTRIEKKVKGDWVRVTDLEIAKKRLKPIEYKEVKITTSTDTYTFKLPRPVAVPNNMDQASAALYITFDLLGIKPTVKHKKETK